MRKFLTARKFPVTLSGAILIGLALTGVAYAISSAAFRYSTPKTGYLMVPAAAFAPRNQSDLFNNSGGVLTTTGTECFIAPVNLPQGAKMAQLAMWYAKNDATSVFLSLERLSPSDVTAVDVANVAAADTDGVINLSAASVTDPSLGTVNNARYGYYLVNCVSDTEAFISARIKYTYKTAGD